ncbi:RRP12-like protein [Trichonephila clavipes]|nr:RRP12-like protein [Trichonephila clavipes]
MTSTRKKQGEKDEVLQKLGISLKKNKRKFRGSDDEDDHEVEPGSISHVSKGIHRTLEPKAKRRRPGEEFKAKKAGGDIKKGKYDPYAYIPFNKELLNRRKQIKVKGQFKSIVRGAKKGAAAGMKRKSREAKRWKNH